MPRRLVRCFAVLSLLVVASSSASFGPLHAAPVAATQAQLQSGQSANDACAPEPNPNPQLADPNQAIEDPIPCPIVRGTIQAQLEVRAHRCGLTAPLYGTFAPGLGPEPGKTTTQPRILYVVDQDGPLWALDTRTGAKTLFINTRPLLVPLGIAGPGTFDERGFLGVAFHPDYQLPGAPGFGKFYTYTSEPPGTLNTDTHNHFNVVREWQAANPLTAPPVHPCPDESREPSPEEAAPDQAVMVRELLRIQWPQFNHNGGAIFFGTRAADRRVLYVTTGDGGCADDQNLQTGFQLVPPCTGHGPGSEATAPNRFGNGQDPLAAWGKLLQIVEPAAAAPMVVTEESRVVPPTMVKAFGLRNPWRASSDRADLGGSGDIWIGDVGQNHIEEVDHVAEADAMRPTLAGQTGPVLTPNFGWHLKEGTFQFNPFLYVLFDPPSDGFVYAKTPGVPADMRDSMGEYDHDEGTAVIGGFVYRGADPALQRLRGRYVFGDWSRRFLNGEGQVFYLDESDSTAEDADQERTPRVYYLTNGPLSNNTFVYGFGEDAQGNLYVLGNERGLPFREDGVVGKLVRRCADESFINGRRHSPDCRD